MTHNKSRHARNRVLAHRCYTKMLMRRLPSSAPADVVGGALVVEGAMLVIGGAVVTAHIALTFVRMHDVLVCPESFIVIMLGKISGAMSWYQRVGAKAIHKSTRGAQSPC